MTESSFRSTSELIRQEFKEWKSTDISVVNNNTVRFRLMKNITTNWHSHSDSDELFILHKGRMEVETENEKYTLNPGDVFKVSTGIRHRVKVTDYAELFVVDAIK
ncbi:cupin domain-containing protein [Exilibacterium tricleocarpae]|uniref:Cupin domain-containing protein n=1 Tax=Exilibacterium tricleocarpae TaxID=2591008 RepID=A0A545TYW7_9GAMM|nr:cupin domain-containing protein [Exilibacterium tricleocarpae]TQV82394.1 cupin domain-containing protein [Exilibacterium tricleocarpae]